MRHVLSHGMRADAACACALDLPYLRMDDMSTPVNEIDTVVFARPGVAVATIIKMVSTAAPRARPSHGRDTVMLMTARRGGREEAEPRPHQPPAKIEYRLHAVSRTKTGP
jgi:hypothetical protein